MSTESELRDWRDGQVKAERLCAELLKIAGYSDVDPQAPLGGPDDRRDIATYRDGFKYVAAVYFPPTASSISKIRRKFVADLEGVGRHRAAGFVFFVNQPLTVTERTQLISLVPTALLCEIFHLERIRSLLDSPQGYGIRLEYLRRAMSLEEQIAFFSVLRQEMRTMFDTHEERITRLIASQLSARLDDIHRRTFSIEAMLAGAIEPSSMDQTSTDLAQQTIFAKGATMASLDIGVLQLIHRALMDGLSDATILAGQIRTVQVWIGTPDSPSHTPPRAEEVPDSLAELLAKWREQYVELRSAARIEATVAALAELHFGIVNIHPFMDGNGRVARFVIDQAAQELLRRRVGPDLTRDTENYYKTLGKAQRGDLTNLAALIRSALI